MSEEDLQNLPILYSGKPTNLCQGLPRNGQVNLTLGFVKFSVTTDSIVWFMCLTWLCIFPIERSWSIFLDRSTLAFQHACLWCLKVQIRWCSVSSCPSVGWQATYSGQSVWITLKLNAFQNEECCFLFIFMPPP